LTKKDKTRENRMAKERKNGRSKKNTEKKERERAGARPEFLGKAESDLEGE